MRGIYSFEINVKNKANTEGKYLPIKGVPFTLEVYPNDPAANFSVATGSGVTQVNIGRVEEIFPNLKDILKNDYNKEYF